MALMIDSYTEKFTASHEILGAIKERMFSPVWGTFFFILIVANWNIVSVYLFSKETIFSVNELINNVEYPWLNFFLIPGLLTLSYLLCYDWIYGQVQIYRESRRLEVEKRMQKIIQQKAMLKVKELKSIELANASDEAQNLNKELNKTNKDIEEIKKIINQKKSEQQDLIEKLKTSKGVTAKNGYKMQEDLSAELKLLHSDESDILEEIDVYVTYGLYNQAEERLINELKTQPDNEALKLKLLEIYLEENNARKYKNQLENIMESGNEKSKELARKMIESAGLSEVLKKTKNSN